MNLAQVTVLVKALADLSRLRLMKTVVEKPHCVEDLALRLKLAPSTVSFHMRKLELAGLVTKEKQQYYTIFQADSRLLDQTLRQLLAAETSHREEVREESRLEADRQKVLQTFMRAGRVQRLPVQQKKRLVILRHIAARFEADREYDEAEVNATIADLFDDYCTVRRYFIDYGLMRRQNGRYWLV
jgi:DNA-binding transcriptional ArsR family regulator